jgi:hypothetical protein
VLLTLGIVLQTSVLSARSSRPRRSITLTSAVAREATLAAPVEPPPPAPPGLPPLPPGFQWSLVESPDLTIYIANLQFIGCPPETIFDIIKPEHDDQFAARMETLFAPFATRFWELMLKGEKNLEKEYGKPIEALGEEKKVSWEKLEALIGYQPPAKTRTNRNLQRLADFLPAEKQKQFAVLNAQFDALEADLTKPTDGPIPADRSKRLKALRDQRAEAIQNLLTPAELAEYQVRTSAHAHWAERVIGFEPKPEEFAAVALLKQKLDTEFPAPKAGDPDARELKAQRQVAEDLRLLTLLGPQRFAEYQRGLDAGYQAAVKVATYYDLPPERATQVYDIKRATEEHLRAIRTDASLSAEEKAAALVLAGQDVAESLQKLLGEKAFQTYAQHDGGWLARLRAP